MNTQETITKTFTQLQMFLSCCKCGCYNACGVLDCIICNSLRQLCIWEQKNIVSDSLIYWMHLCNETVIVRQELKAYEQVLARNAFMIFTEIAEIVIYMHTHTHTESTFFTNPAFFPMIQKPILLRWSRIYPQIIAKWRFPN